MLTREHLIGRHQIIPGQESGTLTRTAEGVTLPVQLEVRPITAKSPFASQVTGFADQSEVVLHAREIGSAPRPGDTITDASGVVWRILDCREELLRTRFRCLVVRNVG